MAYSYNEILERMENKYRELSGHEAAECGDIGIRLKLLAGELYSLGNNMDWLKRQMFFTTATGEQLDMYAMQRGIKRIRGNKASGELAIVLDTPLDYDMDVPKGTVCTTADGGLNFVIDETTTIKKGTARTICHACAEHSGKKYNVKRGYITTMVTYFSVGMYLENASVFSGGTDDESDDELRERIAESYKNISNGANTAYYKNLVESIDGVQSCAVIESKADNSVTSIYVAGRGGLCTSNCLSKVAEAIKTGKCMGETVNVLNAKTAAYNVSVKIEVKPGYVGDKVIESVEENIKNYFNSLRVAQKVILAEIGRVLMDTDGVENYTFSDMQDGNADESVLMVLGSMNVSIM